MMSKEKTILMAVGSSGGHIYPAVAVAEHFNVSVNQIHFVHSGSPLSRRLLSALDFPVHEIPIGGLATGQSLFQKIKTLLQLPKALFQSFLLIRKIKAQVVLGTGGAVTGPVLIAAFIMGCQTAVWEGNALMGLANRVLSLFVSRVFTVFPLTHKFFSKKYILCPYPLRKKILNSVNSSLDVGPDSVFRVLILGGSQGSLFFNKVVSQALMESDWRKGIFIYHQTGENSFLSMKEKYQSLKDVEVFAFKPNIEDYYLKCDLVFSRAGSGAIWEAAVFSKALVLIPLTRSAGGHQLKNAKDLFSKNYVELIKEQDFNPNMFKDKVIQIKADRQKRKQLGCSLNSACQGDGAQQIADWIKTHF